MLALGWSSPWASYSMSIHSYYASCTYVLCIAVLSAELGLGRQSGSAGSAGCQADVWFSSCCHVFVPTMHCSRAGSYRRRAQPPVSVPYTVPESRSNLQKCIGRPCTISVCTFPIYFCNVVIFIPILVHFPHFHSSRLDHLEEELAITNNYDAKALTETHLPSPTTRPDRCTFLPLLVPGDHLCSDHAVCNLV